MIDNRISKYFPPALRSIGYLFMGIGVAMAFGSPITGIALALAGAAISFTVSGVQIDPDRGRIRDYTGLFMIKLGKWAPLDGYSDIAVLRKRIKTAAYSRANLSTTTSDEVAFDICLLDKTHRKKRVIERHLNADAAEERAKALARTLGSKYGQYNPEISAATRARRR